MNVGRKIPRGFIVGKKNQDFVIRSAKGEINGKTSKNTKQ
jgi:hypothetical protein